MHRALRTLGFALIGLATLAGASSAKGLVLNPQAGLTATHLTSDPADITDQARVGYGFGGNVRIGGSVYLSPGAYVQRTSLQITARDTLTATTVKDFPQRWSTSWFTLSLRVPISRTCIRIPFDICG